MATDDREMSTRGHVSICVVDDDRKQVESVSSRLGNDGFASVGTQSPEEALEKIRIGAYRVMLADLEMRPMDGMTFLEKVLQFDPGMYVILVSGHYSVDSAVDALKHGAYDFLCKPIDFARLEKTLDELGAVFSQRSQVRDLQEKLFHTAQLHGIIGKSPAMLEVLELAKKVARHYSNVLITGPTGSGKELVAAPCTS